MIGRGEIWWYEEPSRGKRPYLILTRDEAIGVLNQVVAVPATTTVRGIPSEVALDGSDGMPEACVLSLDNISTIRKSLLIERITKLGPHRMQEVCRALSAATACFDPR